MFIFKVWFVSIEIKTFEREYTRSLLRLRCLNVNTEDCLFF